MSEVTRVLSAIEQGDGHAAEQLLPLVYDELRNLAAAKLAREKPGQTLQATALVHEAYNRSTSIWEEGEQVMVNRSTSIWVALMTLLVVAFGSPSPPTFADGGMVMLPNGGAYEVALGAALDATTGKIYCSGFAGSSTTLAGGVLSSGDLNTAFGGGVVLTPVAAVVSGYRGRDASNACVVQPDGKLVSGGWYVEGKPSRESYGFALVRYTANGTLDRTFNKTGIVKTSFGSKVARINAVALQSDGKILVAGRYENPSRCVVLARYAANGTLDSTFGSAGKVITTIAGEGMGIALHAGGIVVGADTPDGMAVIRFTASGALDRSFGASGIVRFAVPDPTPGAYTDLHALAVDPLDNGLIVAGKYSDGLAYHLTLARFTADGTPDATFGNYGYTTFHPGPGDYVAESVAVDADGKVVVAGCASEASTNVLVARFDEWGNLDPTFNEGLGYADDFPGDAHSLFIQSDGKIVAAGAITNQGSSPQTSTMIIVRYGPDGIPDQSF